MRACQLQRHHPFCLFGGNTWIGIVDTAMSQQTHIVMWGTVPKNKAGCETETELWSAGRWKGGKLKVCMSLVGKMTTHWYSNSISLWAVICDSASSVSACVWVCVHETGQRAWTISLYLVRLCNIKKACDDNMTRDKHKCVFLLLVPR